MIRITRSSSAKYLARDRTAGLKGTKLNKPCPKCGALKHEKCVKMLAGSLYPRELSTIHPERN